MKKALFCSLVSLSAFAADGPDVGERNVQKPKDATAELITITLDGEPLSFDPGVLNRCETFRDVCRDCRYEDYTKMVQEAAQNHIFKELTHAQAKRFIDLLNMEDDHQIREHLAQYISDHKEQARKDLLALYEQADYMNVSSVYKACKRVIGKADINFGDLPAQLYVPILHSRINKALLGVCGLQSTVLKGHTDGVNSAVFSPDGKLIASASRDKTVRIWDAQTGDCPCILQGHTGWVFSAVFSPDGKQTALTSGDTTVRIWDVEKSCCQHILRGHTDWVNSAVFSPDGQQVASASCDATVRIWDIDADVCRHTLEGHTGFVVSVAFSPDGKRIVSASTDETVRIWNADTGECLQVLRGHTASVRSAAFSPDGKRIVSASNDRTVRVWNADTGDCSQTLRGHTRPVKSVAFSPDGKRIVSASADRTVRIWNAGTGNCLHTLQGHDHFMLSVAFSPDGELIASASCDKTVRIWRDYKKWLKTCSDELIELLDKARISWQDKKPYPVRADEKDIIDRYIQDARFALLKDKRLFTDDISED